MSRLGLRANASILAMAAISIAAIIGTALLLTTLRSSLIDEIDRSNLARADDISSQWDSDNEEVVLGIGFDELAIAAIVDSSGFYDTTNTFVSDDVIRSSSSIIGEPFTVSIQLDSELEPEQLRAIALLADDSTAIITDDFTPGDEPIVFVGSSLAPTDATVRRILLGAAIIGPLFVLMVGAMTWFLTGRSLRPVEAIRKEVESISAKGLDRRVPQPKSGDEVGRLAGTMNRMLGRLEESQHAQQQFVSDASHELRSPLASMSAILDVAERHGTAADWEDTAQDLQRETHRMRRMVDDLLLLARADADTRTLAGSAAATSLVDLDDIVLDVVRSTVVRNGVSIDTSGVSAGLVSGDADQLRRAVINLTTNAVRHASSTVQVSLHETAGQVTLVVEDDGSGIPVDQREAIFERFVRLDEARGRDAGGSGLGLAITKEIATAHNGTVSADQSELGGARFQLHLPQH